VVGSLVSRVKIEILKNYRPLHRSLFSPSPPASLHPRGPLHNSSELRMKRGYSRTRLPLNRPDDFGPHSREGGPERRSISCKPTPAARSLPGTPKGEWGSGPTFGMISFVFPKEDKHTARHHICKREIQESRKKLSYATLYMWGNFSPAAGILKCQSVDNGQWGGKRKTSHL